jgi:hypothetical protein
MKKKAVILISLIATVLVGVGITAFALLQDNFSFSNLNVDISQSNALGVGMINPTAPLNGRRNQAGSSEDNEFNKLLKVNEDGEVEIIRFYNEGENEVQIPFHPILIEPFGEFIYIIYSDWPAEYHQILQSSQNQLKFIFWQTYLDLAYNNDKPFQYEFIAIHALSGKVFDLKEQILDLLTENKTLISTLVYLVDGFSYITQMSQQNNEVCINRGMFNSENQVIDMTKVCTDVIDNFYNPYESIALPNGDIKLQANGNLGINLYTFQTFKINELSDDNPMRLLHGDFGAETFYLSTSKYMAILNGQQLLEIEFNQQGSEHSISTFPENLDYLDLLDGRNPYSKAPFYTLSKLNNQSDIPIEDQPINVLEVYPENLLIDIVIEDFKNIEYISLHDHYLNFVKIQNSLYIFKVGENPFIYEFNLINNTLEKIFFADGFGYIKAGQTQNPNFFLFGQEFYEFNGLYSFKSTGNFYFTLLENLVQTTYKFNIFTKLTYLEFQSTPKYSYFEIVPIN